jgi:hypothetical protein
MVIHVIEKMIAIPNHTMLTVPVSHADCLNLELGGHTTARTEIVHVHHVQILFIWNFETEELESEAKLAFA